MAEASSQSEFPGLKIALSTRRDQAARSAEGFDRFGLG